MKLLLTPDTRLVDEATCRHYGITPLQLMQRATACAEGYIAQRYQADRAWRNIHVLIGPGNNGGDARIIADLLERDGFCYVHRYDFSRRDGIPQMPELDRRDLVIDGLFGSGLNRPLAGGFAYLVQRVNSSGAEVVSIDIPSGLMGESNAGNDPSAIIRADLTLTFSQPKLSMLMPEGGSYVGEMQVIDIDIPQSIIEQTVSPYQLIADKEMAALLHRRSRFAHKGAFGHAWLAAGSQGMMGAVLLAARACMRSGVGLLTVHAPSCGCPILQTGIPEAKCEVDVSADRISALNPPSSCTAIGLGPGMGQASDTARALGLLLQRESRPMVIDADALNLLAAHPAWLQEVHRNTILTPHPKEADRLLQAAWKAGLLDTVPGCRELYGVQGLKGLSELPDALQENYLNRSLIRLSHIRSLARLLHIVIVLKGSYTAVCLPSGETWFQHLHGNSGMAVGGSGDTLTGIILALLAQGYKADEAALLGVHLHALAGDLALVSGSEESLLPSDLIEHIGAAFRTTRQ